MSIHQATISAAVMDVRRSLDLSAGYSYSVYSVLDTFSFGLELNVGSLLKKPSTE
jgi:hypothetical protein